MTATKRTFNISQAQGRTFPAQFPGECAGCGGSFQEGDPVFYTADDELYAEDGCDLPDPEIPLYRDAPPTMPRGRTARDKCSVCFEILASNGACSC